MNRYLVKLTPHDKFFFGGEKTFGEGDKKNYFVKSQYFPQQTGLLGLVRYQLLVQNNNGIFEKNEIVSNKKNEVVDLIGEESYKISNNFSFGVIKSLSPVFIIGKDNNFIFPANKEYQWVDVDKNKNKINDFVMNQFEKIEENANCSINNKNFIPFMNGYDPKKDLPDLLIDKKLTKYKYSDIFIEQKQVGIRKNYDGITDEKAFYVQLFYKLANGYSFAFILELDDKTKFKSNNLVILGGEQSKFKMEVISVTNGKVITTELNELFPDYEPSINSDKIVLVSDAYVSNKILGMCDFAVTDIISFRALVSNVNDTKFYSSLDKTKGDKSQLQKTEKINLFKKGSVFYYSSNYEQIEAEFKNYNLKDIGYNFYKKIEKKNEN